MVQAGGDSSVEAQKRYDYKIETEDKGKLSLLKTIENITSEPVIPVYNIKPDSVAGNGISVMLDFKLLSFSIWQVFAFTGAIS